MRNEGKKWTEGVAGVEPGLGEGDSVLGTLGLVCDLASGRGIPSHAESSFLKLSSLCFTCLATAGLVSSFIQQIFTELLNPRAGLAMVSLPFSEPQSSSSESWGCLSLPFSCHQARKTW